MKKEDFEKLSLIDEHPLSNYLFQGKPVVVKVYHDKSTRTTYQFAEEINQYRFAKEDDKAVVEYSEWKTLEY